MVGMVGEELLVVALVTLNLYPRQSVRLASPFHFIGISEYLPTLGNNPKMISFYHETFKPFWTHSLHRFVRISTFIPRFAMKLEKVWSRSLLSPLEMTRVSFECIKLHSML